MDDYEIGYGKPPQHTRFKPGTSGNPHGRPKGAQNVATLLLNELAQKIPVTVNGKKTKITTLEGIVKAAVMKGLKGDPRPLIHVHELLNKIGKDPFTSPDKTYEVTLIFDEEETRAKEKAQREEAARIAGQNINRDY